MKIKRTNSYPQITQKSNKILFNNLFSRSLPANLDKYERELGEILKKYVEKLI